MYVYIDLVKRGIVATVQYIPYECMRARLPKMSSSSNFWSLEEEHFKRYSRDYKNEEIRNLV
jgi:hypothetical protein